LVRRGDQTVLCESRSELPLQVQRPIVGPHGEAIVTLLTPAGALLDGDVVTLEVDCGPGTDVVLRQTGATRLNRCTTGGIDVQADFRVAGDARLRVLPYELIPFAGARYAQTFRAHLQEGAEAAFLEIVAPGTLELPFAYADLALRLEAWLGDDLAALDALRVQPEPGEGADLKGDPGLPTRAGLQGGSHSPAALGGYSHFGTLILLGPRFDQAAADCLHHGFEEAAVQGSASLLPSYGVGARFIGRSADALRRAVRRATRDLSLFGATGYD
jgi:urease accessory protein